MLRIVPGIALVLCAATVPAVEPTPQAFTADAATAGHAEVRG